MTPRPTRRGLSDNPERAAPSEAGIEPTLSEFDMDLREFGWSALGLSVERLL